MAVKGLPRDEPAFSADFAARTSASALGRAVTPCCAPMPTTERLVLRAWRPADRVPFSAINADPDVMRYIRDGRPMTRAESDHLLEAIQSHWAEHGFGLWCAAPREDPDACLGFIGLAVPSFLPVVLPAVEVGWRLARSAWGRGLATEGARAALSHAFGPLGLSSVISIIDPVNERSVRVAEKLGMRPAATHRHPMTRRTLCAYEISSVDAGFPRGDA
jgi:RimJ/RimL family protein N-acetyltransferase